MIIQPLPAWLRAKMP